MVLARARATFELIALAEQMMRQNLQQDLVFELLYPRPDSYEDAPKGELLVLSLREIARRWKEEGHTEAANRLAVYEREVRDTGRPCWPRRAPDLCKVVAGLVDDPEAWLDAFLERELPYDLVQPFLERMVEDKRDGWEGIFSRLLEEDRHSVFVLGLLGRGDLPSALTSKVLERADRSPCLIEAFCQKGVVPLSTLKDLLSHADQKTSLAAAVGEWLAEPREQVRPELRANWRAVILNAGQEETENGGGRNGSSFYWLETILLHDRDLAFEWVLSRLRDAPQRRP